MQNGQEHIAEPLDYLYEELPPERMAEVRKHLAECPECRTRMREIRDTVKAYRQIPHPKPPAGLAARVAEAAVREADTGAVGLLRGRIPSAAALASSLDHMAAEPQLTPREREAKMEEEFNKLKDELQGEMRRGWRTWLFHPAWAVAASVAFLCTLAMHFSPRLNRYPDTVYVRPSLEAESPARRIRERAPLPEAQPRATEDMPLEIAAASPILQQARARQETVVLEPFFPNDSLAVQSAPAPSSSPAPLPASAVELTLQAATKSDAAASQLEPNVIGESDAGEILLGYAPPTPAPDAILKEQDATSTYDGFSSPRANLPAQKKQLDALRPPAASAPVAGTSGTARLAKAAQTTAREQKDSPVQPPAVSIPELSRTQAPSVPAQPAISALCPPPTDAFVNESEEIDLQSSSLMADTADARYAESLSPSSALPPPSPSFGSVTLAPVQDFSSLPPLEDSTVSTETALAARPEAVEPPAPQSYFASSAGGSGLLDANASAPSFGDMPATAAVMPPASMPAELFNLSGGAELSPADLAAMENGTETDNHKAEVVIVDMLRDMPPPQLIARPTPVNVPERIQSLTMLASMHMSNGDIPNAWKAIEMLRHYDAKAAETLSELLRDMEKASLAEIAPAAEQADAETKPAAGSATAGYAAEPDLPGAAFSSQGQLPAETEAASKYDALLPPSKYDAISREAEAFEQAPPAVYEAEPIPVPEDVVAPRPSSLIGEMVEPPEDPPISLVRVPPSVPPPAAQVYTPSAEPLDIEPAYEYVEPPSSLRQRGNGSRSAALVQTLSQALPTQGVAAPSSPDQEEYFPAATTVPPEPAVAAPPPDRQAPAQRAAKRPFTTDPYLRDY